MTKLSLSLSTVCANCIRKQRLCYWIGLVSHLIPLFCSAVFCSCIFLRFESLILMSTWFCIFWSLPRYFNIVAVCSNASGLFVANFTVILSLPLAKQTILLSHMGQLFPNGPADFRLILFPRLCLSLSPSAKHHFNWDEKKRNERKR